MLEILKTDGSTVVLKLNIDRATMANVENFKASLDGIVSQYKKVIIDLSAVNFIDSVFLGSFVVLLKRLSVNNGEL
ncbi:MAG TPA: STAS domain-containing protein, partial [Ignavibacteriales bacterium]|nr:STAS domain-containing protein [Ignavibacteriales bacterium]